MTLPGAMPDPLTVPTSPSPAPPVSPTAPPTVNVSQNVVIIQRSTGPGFFVRTIWFIFVGWWLSGLAIVAAYFLCVIIIGLPLGFMIFNRLPVILTLRPRTDSHTIEIRDGVTYVTGGTVEQYPLWARALWFVFVGWWVGAIYLGVAWLLCVIIITLPIGLLMFNRVGAVMTLLRY
ncbi:MAG: YccF domain-containing protein [Chloroflexota bacterium]